MLDFAKIRLQAGNGGKGLVSFRREKFVPMGGPNGGDGGRGGDVYLEASEDVATLLDFQYRDHFEAQSGEPGGTSDKAGKSGEDLIIKVPVGSIIKINRIVSSVPEKKNRKDRYDKPNIYTHKILNYRRMEIENSRKKAEETPSMDPFELDSDNNAVNNPSSNTQIMDEEIQQKIESGEMKLYQYTPPTTSAPVKPTIEKEIKPPVFDLDTPGKRILLARGGVGGRGNSRFKTNEEKAPHFAEAGQGGEHVEIEINLKLIAQLGLIGLPNAGKSSLLAKLTNSNPKIASYPFTTLEPNLGVMEYQGAKYVVADIPGLIEGASAGKGLGFKFLKHTERTALLIHLVAIPDNALENTSEEVIEEMLYNYETIRTELLTYGRGLENKPEIIVINKIDLIPTDQRSEYIQKIENEFKKHTGTLIFISTVDGQGIEGFKKVVTSNLQLSPNL